MSIEEKFIEYASRFSEKECIYKVEHTLRVVSLALSIGKSLGLSDDDLYLVELASMLHDIGRFEQMKRYHTFVDSKSKYHGDIGIEILLENNLIDNFCKNDLEKNIVLKTCKYHGTLEVADDLSDKERLIVNIVRDSDKLDILNNAILENIKLDIGNDTVSENIKEDFYDHKLIEIVEKNSKADRLVIWLAFVYDFNFKYTYKYLKDKNVMERLVSLYITKTSNSECINEYKKMLEEVDKYIESKI